MARHYYCPLSLSLMELASGRLDRQLEMATRAASAVSGTTSSHAVKRPHSAIDTAHPPAALSTLSLSSLAQPDSPTSTPASPPSPPSPFTRPPHLQQLVDSHIPYLYDFYYVLPLEWPLYTMCWSHELPDTTLSYRNLTKGDQKRYRMHRLYYAQSTDASYDPYYGRFIGHPHTLIQAEMPLPQRPNTADMEDAAGGGEGVLEDVFCSYVTDFRKLAHPGEINRIRVVQQADDIVCTHTDSPRVYVWNFSRQPTRIVKKNCRPHWPDLQLVGHVEATADDGKKPMYFALDTSSGSEAMVLSGGPDRQVCLWGLDDYVSSLSRTEVTSGAALASGNGAGNGSGVSELLQARGVFSGHSECVEDVCFHPHTAQQFASVGDDCMLNLWDARTALTPVVALHSGHTDDVNAVSYNPLFPHLLLTASSDHTVRLVDVRRAGHSSGGDASASVVHVFREHEREVKNVCWAADGVHFASGGDDALVNIHDITLLPTPPAPPLPVNTATAGYHATLAASSQPPSDPSLLFRHVCHPSAVQCVSWYGGHRGGLTVASVSGETGGVLQVWRMAELLCGGGIEERNNAVKAWKRHRKERTEDKDLEKVEYHRGKP